MTPGPTIVAIGGAGFAPETEPILRYVLELTGADRPRVAFLPTASGDSRDYIVRFYASFTSLGCAPSHVELHGAPERAAVAEHLLAQDAIYVGGGNTANMLAVWRLHGVDEVLREAWARGIVLTGTSAARTAGSRRARPIRSARSAACATGSASSRAASRRTTTPSRSAGRRTDAS